MDDKNKIGLIPATLMVSGNMMGSGVFMLPANLAAIGSIAIFGWLITIAGAIALALTFSKLTQIYPAAGINKVNKDVLGEYARDIETVFETYLDYGISDYLIISPDIQYYLKPALNRKTDNAFVYSIRATLLF